MALTSLPAAGSKLRASVLSALITEVRRLWVPMTADQILTASSTTMQDLTELVIAIQANATYRFRARLVSTVAGTVVDVKYGCTYPTGATVTEGAYGPEVALAGGTSIAQGEWGANAADSSSPSTSHTFGSTTSATNGFIEGFIVVGSTAGNFQMQAAEAASNATQPSVKAGSELEMWRVA